MGCCGSHDRVRRPLTVDCTTTAGATVESCGASVSRRAAWGGPPRHHTRPPSQSTTSQPMPRVQSREGSLSDALESASPVDPALFPLCPVAPPQDHRPSHRLSLESAPATGSPQPAVRHLRDVGAAGLANLGRNPLLPGYDGDDPVPPLPRNALEALHSDAGSGAPTEGQVLAWVHLHRVDGPFEQLDRGNADVLHDRALQLHESLTSSVWSLRDASVGDGTPASQHHTIASAPLSLPTGTAQGRPRPAPPTKLPSALSTLSLRSHTVSVVNGSARSAPPIEPLCSADASTVGPGPSVTATHPATHPANATPSGRSSVSNLSAMVSALQSPAASPVVPEGSGHSFAGAGRMPTHRARLRSHAPRVRAVAHPGLDEKPDDDTASFLLE